MVWASRLSLEGRRRLGLTALVLTVSALILAALALAGDSHAAQAAAADERVVQTNEQRVFGGSVAPTVRASGSARAPAATDDVWSAVTSEGSPSLMPIAGDGAAVSGSTTGSNLPLGLLLLGAGALTLLCGLVAATAHGRIHVG